MLPTAFQGSRESLREIIFFVYIILMLMPYQVTLVPNYLVSEVAGHLLDTRLGDNPPGNFLARLAVFLLTKAYEAVFPRHILKQLCWTEPTSSRYSRASAYPMCKKRSFLRGSCWCSLTTGTWSSSLLYCFTDQEVCTRCRFSSVKDKLAAIRDLHLRWQLST